MPMRKNIKFEPVAGQYHWRLYEYPKTELLVPQKALAEAQVVILNRELCIQLELFSISTSSEMITKAS